MKNHQKGFIVPALIAIVALLIIGGGVYIYENKKVETFPVTHIETHQFEQSDTNNQSPAVQTKIQVQQTTKPATPNIDSQSVTKQICTSSVQAQNSQSSEYASLILPRWTFKTAILSDFNCNGKEDVLVTSTYSVDGGLFKINLQLFEKDAGSWKLIIQKDALGEPFEIHPIKMSDGTYAAEMTLNQSHRKVTIYFKNNYLYDI